MTRRSFVKRMTGAIVSAAAFYVAKPWDAIVRPPRTLVYVDGFEYTPDCCWPLEDRRCGVRLPRGPIRLTDCNCTVEFQAQLSESGAAGIRKVFGW